MYTNGRDFRAIERAKGVHHTTIIYWVKQISQHLADAPKVNAIPEVTELDELKALVGKGKTRFG